MADIETIGWSSALAVGATTLLGVVSKVVEYFTGRRKSINDHDKTLIELMQNRIEKLEGHVEKCNAEMLQRVDEIGGLRKENVLLTEQVKELKAELNILKGQK